jgi:hypothetical protein
MSCVPNFCATLFAQESGKERGGVLRPWGTYLSNISHCLYAVTPMHCRPPSGYAAAQARIPRAQLLRPSATLL